MFFIVTFYENVLILPLFFFCFFFLLEGKLKAKIDKVNCDLFSLEAVGESSSIIYEVSFFSFLFFSFLLLLCIFIKSDTNF